MGKHTKKSNKNVKRIVIILLSIICICSISLFIKFKMAEQNDNKTQEEISQVLSTINVPNEDITPETTERMLQIRQLKTENQDIIGWLEIDGTNINYPVLQGTDNEYYLTHSYKKETIAGGSLFLDKDYNFDKPSENLLIYGHRNSKGLMFEDLIKYKYKDFFNQHPIIRFTTTEEDNQYEIISVFYSRVYYQDETNVFRYYYFVNANNVDEFNNFVNEAKKASIYDTGKTATYGDQLLTLSTCEYSQGNGRFVVVAKKIK